MVFDQLTHQLGVLQNMLQNLEEGFYTIPVQHLASASIGAHTRHIIEMVDCALNGYHSGKIDYINRNRDLQLESDPSLAIEQIARISSNIRHDDKPLEIVSESYDGDGTQLLKSSFLREMSYITEHTIHHMALIKAGLIELKSSCLSETFGVAYSTLKYRASLQPSQ
ncbi:MAG: hypothetical protein RLZZ557_1429 [Bacteroidota bacterium]|jgi:hypothetical protein